ncbi:hypothetical protein Smar_1422 [Staphylothermus marinus F1]|uniref:Uncharacterized protein n=1 Tax=Staphylothermus marinus (strain ATCC 43588 / DSM 3639 / JCM 9404 / F1) TaxID=399550 RepID=A3DPF2_STAMF|nr:hypothetical protein [Staphylothermus marinus]ABN70512.1 hypothetical protein Smar_1422 [Staphylothermus marinus F1]
MMTIIHSIILNNQTTTNVTGTEILWDALKLALRDLVEALPAIAITLVIIAIYSLIAFILTRIVQALFKLVNIDAWFKPLQEYRIRLSSIIILLINIGIVLLAIYSIVALLYPSNIPLITYIVLFIGRIASVIFVTIFMFLMLETIIERIRMEAKLRGFMFLLILFISLALVLDVTTLSNEVKNALAFGISLGIGLMIGVFAAWYFFHDVIEKKIKGKQ